MRNVFVLENVKGREIFSLSFVQEYNAVKIVLAKAKTSPVAEAISRLGLIEEFERLTQCHDALRLLVGVGTTGVAPDGNAFERFDEARGQLAGAILLFLGKDADEHRYWRSLIMGPISKHIEQYRERRRKQNEKKKADTTPIAKTDPTP